MSANDDIATTMYNALARNGYRLTAARRAIVGALASNGDHVTADALVEIVNRRSPGIGRMTVYRTLDVLCDLGLLRPVYQGTGAAHYVLLHNGHHHHLVCSHCGRVVEFDQCALDELEQAVARRLGFLVQGHLLELYGLCADCRADAAASRPLP